LLILGKISNSPHTGSAKRAADVIAQESLPALRG
jgi:hypothetical protein